MTGQPLPGVTALLVEPHQEFAATLEKNVELLGCSVGGVAKSAIEAIEIVAERPIDLVFIDETVGGSDLSFLISQLSARGLPYIFIAGDARDRAGRLEPTIHRNATPDRIALGMKQALEKSPHTWPASKWEP
jgi:CheY-like chemotaxis protein